MVLALAKLRRTSIVSLTHLQLIVVTMNESQVAGHALLLVSQLQDVKLDSLAPDATPGAMRVAGRWYLFVN